MKPRVSVLMAVYNAASYLQESIESLLGQTFTDFELIAIDDASTDTSLKILRQYAQKDARIKVISLQENGGQGHARNEGLKIAQGEYVCFVDSDDRLSNDALEQMVAAFDAKPQIGCVLFRLAYTDSMGKLIGYYPMDKDYKAAGEKAFADSLTWKIHGVYAVRADIHHRYPYDTTSHAYSDDNTTRLHYLASKEVVACAGIYYYRQHSQSVTHQVSIRRFDYLLANASMKRQLLELGAAPSLVSLYENERWKNLVDVYLFYYLHRHELTSKERKQGLETMYHTWQSMETHRLHHSLCRKFGYMPLRPFWQLFRLQEEAYFFLRGIFGKNVEA